MENDSEHVFDDGVYEDRYTLLFRDGRVATRVMEVPPGEPRWVLVKQGSEKEGLGVISSLPLNSDNEHIAPGSLVEFSGGTETSPPSFSALLNIA